MFSVKWNTKNTINYLGTIDKNLRKAQISATNKMAAQGLTQARKEIRNRYNIQLQYLTSKNSKNEQITGYKEAHIGQTLDSIKISAEIFGNESWLSLFKFKHKQKNQGVEVEVIKGKPKIYKHTFLIKNLVKATNPGLLKNIWIREYNPSSKDPERAINRKFGPGAATMLRQPEVMKKTIAFINLKFKSIMDHEIKFFLKIK